MNLNNTLLYGSASSGKLKVWKAYTDYAVVPALGIKITKEWGYADGKQQVKDIYVTVGKNIGKANETTITEQAKLKLEQLYDAQLKSGYFKSETELNANNSILPQLAHQYSKKKHLLHGPDEIFIKNVYLQPKLNGIRCLAFKVDETTIKYLSRSGKLFKNFKHITKDLLSMLTIGDIVDGELFTQTVPFEIIASLVNSDDEDVVVGNYDITQLQYHLYDKFSSDAFITRYSAIASAMNCLSVKLVETTKVLNMTEVRSKFEAYVTAGYEGVMLRDDTVPYMQGQRSNGLLKYKIMLSDEFLIHKIYLAANDPTKVQIICVNHNVDPESPHRYFDVGSVKGTKEYNVETYFNNKEALEGVAYLTVDYQALSLYSVPLFPVGIALREGEVVNNIFVPTV
jgi:hypothetical protein